MFNRHNLAAVLSGEVPPSYFENRIVLIGPYATGFKDDFLTAMGIGCYTWQQ
ncbi:CHASE2 domain-containing protein [Acinetobacter sp. CUI P1]|nr:CHASE2 domain-containing protein [Acinetobacter sp. CUI P1]